MLISGSVIGNFEGFACKSKHVTGKELSMSSSCDRLAGESGPFMEDSGYGIKNHVVSLILCG